MALLLTGFVTVGCDAPANPFVMSLQPLYTKSDLETDRRLPGVWTDKDGEVTFSFEEGTDQQYQLTIKESEEGRDLSGEFEAHLVRLGGTWFLDLFPKGASEGDEFYRMHFLRAHSIARVEITEDSIKMAFLNASWLMEKTKEKNVDTPHEDVDGTPVLTGTTQEVQDFVFLYGNDDEAFAEPLSLERQPADGMKH